VSCKAAGAGGGAGEAERSKPLTTGIFANDAGATTTGELPAGVPAFCRICATSELTVCTPSASTTEYCCGPLICGVTITVPIGPGALVNAAGWPAPGTLGTANSGPTGKGPYSA